MRTRSRLAFALPMLIAAVTLVAPSTLMAKRPSSGANGGPQQLLLDESESSTRSGNRWVSDRTGAPVTIFRTGYFVSPDSPEAMARQYLTDNAWLLQFASADLSDLEFIAARETPAGHTVRFRQLLDGVPVDRSQIAVTINRSFEVSFVTNGYQPGLQLDSALASIPQSAARDRAHDRLGVEGPIGFEKQQLIVHHLAGAARLAWQIRVEPAVSPIGDWEVLVDAHTGEVFKLVDRSHYVDGDGGTFDPDPLSSAGVLYGTSGYVDGGDADTPELLAEIFNRVLPDLTFGGGMYSLDGPYAEIVDHEAPFKGLFSQASSSFDFTRFEDGFEAVVCYFHVDQTMRYINEVLGVAVSPYQYAGGAQCDPHGLNGADNSHYSTGSGRMAFGEGGVDDAEDADVVIHELGHGLHDWLTVGGLSQVNGLSEGFGDYVAASYSRSLGQWDTGDPQYHWVFNWDGHNPFWGGRKTNHDVHYPEGLVGQIHTDGQIWSTTNMDVWDAIGREQIDRAMYVGLAMTGSSTNQEQAAAAVLQAAIDLGYPGDQLTAMYDIYSARGYDVDPPPVGLILAVSGDCPGTLDVSLSGASPNARVWLMMGSGPGSDTLRRGPCAGTLTGLDRARAREKTRSDLNGDVELMMDAPGGVCGRPMQALDLRTCTMSNVVTVP